MKTQKNVRDIVTQWWELPRPALIDRPFDTSLLNTHRLITIVGPRRAGKTFTCFQLLDYLKNKVPKQNSVYINLEDERLYPLEGDELSQLWEAYLEVIAPNPDYPIYLVLDEIQSLPNWSRWVRRMHDTHPHLHLILTGSSSKLLSREMSTELRGRATSVEIFPFSFKEFVTASKLSYDLKKLLHSTQKTAIKQCFDSYFKRGGFPGILSLPNPESTLQDYYKAMFFRDLIERFRIKHVGLFEDYLRLQIQHFSALTSLSSMEKTLSSIGYSISKNTLSTYLGYAKESYLLFQTLNYSAKLKNQLKNPKKLYVIDHGLLQSIRFSTSEDYGRLLENIVFLELRRRYSDIFHHRDASGECDFLIQEKNKVTQIIQVTQGLNTDAIKKRELKGLFNVLKDHPNATPLILTDNEADTLTIDGYTIPILPIWYWLLGGGQAQPPLG